MMINEMMKKLRIERGYSQKELGDLLGVSKQAISMYERGERKPDIDMLYRLSQIFSCDMYALCGYDSPHKKSSPDEPKLSEGEKMLVDMFRAIPEEQQKVFLEMGRVYANSLKKD